MHHKKVLGTVARMWQDNIESPFVDALAEMLVYSQAVVAGPNEYIYYDRATSSDHALNRNALSQNFQGDWLLQLDTDHAFAPDLLERLLHFKKKAGARVINGIYQFKYPPHAPVAHVWKNNADLKNMEFEPLIRWDPKDQVIECGPVGGGCMLIDRNVFEEIYRKTGQQPFDRLGGLSEDYSFFYRCRQLGIKTHLALTVQAHHLAPRSYLSVDDYLATTAGTIEVRDAETNSQPDRAADSTTPDSGAELAGQR